MQHYITIEELRKAPFNLPEGILDNTQAEFLLDLTKETIDTLCRQDFFMEGSAGHEVKKIYSGRGTDCLYFDKRLVSLKEVQIYNSVGAWDVYTVDNFTFKPMYVQFNSMSQEPTARIEYDVFPKGNFNIGVVGLWGYATVPAMIRYLQGRMVQKIVREETITEKNSSESIGDYSSSKAMLETSITGDTELDLIVRKHRLWVLRDALI